MKCLAFMLLFAVLAVGQEHAPTAEQCRADAAVWNPTSTQGVDKLSYKEVDLRWQFLMECAKADSGLHKMYMEEASLYRSVLGRRMQDFLKRHDLLAKFLEEDSLGER